MPDTSPESALKLSMFQCSNVSIRISSTPLVMHSTTQVHWFCGVNAIKGRRKKQKTKGGRKTIKINKEKRDKNGQKYTKN
jgi:hypothetical protein